MSEHLRMIWIILKKDLRIEARTRQTIGLVIVLGVLIIVVLGLGLGASRSIGGFGASAILWVAYLFSGVLCFERTMACERHDDALAGLLAAPVDRAAIYAAKLLANLILMFTLAVVVTPIAIVLFRFNLSSHLGGFAIVMAMGMTGFAAIGTLFAAAVSSTRLQGGLLAMLVFPLCLPVVILSTQIMRRVFEQGEGVIGSGLATLAACVFVYLIASWIVFEFVLEP